MEKWEDVVGYEGLYRVSNLGRIKRLVSNRCLKERILKHNLVRGYHRVTLSKDALKEQWSVHRLVAIAFIPNKDSKPLINHLDCDKNNNSAENLEWCTQKENVKHSFDVGFRTGIRGEKNTNSVLTREDAETIKFMAELGFFQKRLAKEYRISQQLVSRIVTGLAWASL